MTRFLRRSSSRQRFVVLGVIAAAILAGAGLATAHAVGAPTATPPELEMTGLPPAKQAILTQELKDRETSPVQTDLTLEPAPDTTTLPARTRGLFDGGGAGPFPADSFVIRNGWHGPFAAVWYIIYAGGYPDDQGDVTQGGVRIYALAIDPNAPDQNLSLVGDYPAITSDALTIESVHGPTVTLQTDNGSQITFDLATKQYGN
jgi:hypothetical protein